VTEEQGQNWIQKIQEVLQTVPLSRINNCDETARLLDPNGVLTWAEPGSESIRAKIHGNEKDCVTVLSSVIAIKTKIPLVFIASRKTGRVEPSQVGNVDNHWQTRQ
jgi:hypothetical protein